ncbi:MAG: hypothetical protein ACRENN_06835 [Candidatus Eiseniibacteriota bacterium]
MGALALTVVSCETLGGSKGSPEEFQTLKDGLTADRSDLSRAVSDGALDRIPDITTKLSKRFDDIWAKSSAMNLVDREHMAIQLASARKQIVSIAQWANSNDADAVRTEIDKLDGILGEVDELLGNTIRAKTSDQPSAS